MTATDLKKRIIPGFFIVMLLVIPGCSDDTISFPESMKRSGEALMVAETGGTSGKIALKREMDAEASYTEIYEKNLFAADRTFTESAEEEAGVEPTPTPQRAAVDLPDFELVGTLTTANADSLAFIKNKKPKDRTKRNKVDKYEIGDWLGDYMVSGIEPAKVTLTRGEELAYLRLKPSETAQRRTAGRRTSRTGRQRARPACGGRTTGRQTETRRGTQERREPRKTTARSAARRGSRTTGARSGTARRGSAESRQEMNAAERRYRSACGGRSSRTRAACGR